MNRAVIDISLHCSGNSLHPEKLIRLKADTHEGFCSRSMHCSRIILHVSVHTRERFQVRSICPGTCSQIYRGTFCGVEILLPRMRYTHEIVGTHGGALQNPSCVSAFRGPASSTSFSCIFSWRKERLGDREGTKGRERDLVASEKFERLMKNRL